MVVKSQQLLKTISSTFTFVEENLASIQIMLKNGAQEYMSLFDILISFMILSSL